MGARTMAPEGERVKRQWDPAPVPTNPTRVTPDTPNVCPGRPLAELTEFAPRSDRHGSRTSQACTLRDGTSTRGYAATDGDQGARGGRMESTGSGRGVLRTIGALLRRIFGTPSWAPPPWMSALAARARRLRAAARAFVAAHRRGVLAGVAGLVVVALAAAGVARWLESRPKPLRI